MHYIPDAERLTYGNYDLEFGSNLDDQHHREEYNSGPIDPKFSPTRRLGRRPSEHSRHSSRTSSPTPSSTTRSEDGLEEYSKLSSRTSSPASSTTSRLDIGLEECSSTSSRTFTAHCPQDANTRLPNRQELDLDITERQSAAHSQQDDNIPLPEPEDSTNEEGQLRDTQLPELETPERTKAQLQDLPPELLNKVISYLKPCDQVSLGLTSKRFYDFSGHGLARLKLEPEQRMELFRVLDPGLPDHRFCSGCSKFHKRQIEHEELFPCITYQAYTRCNEANIPLFHGIYLSWPSTQLALRRLYYDSWGRLCYESWATGCAKETPGFIRQLADTYDIQEHLTWNNHMCWSERKDGLTITLRSLRKWLAQTQINPHQCRGLLLKLDWDDGSCTRRNLIAERTINLDASECRPKVTAQPGWNPPPPSTSLRSRRRARPCNDLTRKHDQFDPIAGLPGLHWYELPPHRRHQNLSLWSAWQWCPRTGNPSNGHKNLELPNYPPTVWCKDFATVCNGQTRPSTIRLTSKQSNFSQIKRKVEEENWFRSRRPQ